MLSRFISKIFWILITALAVPTTLILVSWDAVPGDSTYAIKTNMEQAVLAMALSASSKSNLQIKYTERRFDEVEKVLSQNSNYVDESLTNFNQQLVASKNSLNQIENFDDQEIQTQKLIDTLQVVSQKIQQQKQIASTSLSQSRPQSQPQSQPQPQSPSQVNQPASNYRPTLPPSTGNVSYRPSPTLTPKTPVIAPTIHSSPASLPTAYSQPTAYIPPDPTLPPPVQQPYSPENVVDNRPDLASSPDTANQAPPLNADVFVKLEETSQQVDQIIEELNQSQQNRKNRRHSDDRESKKDNRRQNKDD